MKLPATTTAEPSGDTSTACTPRLSIPASNGSVVVPAPGATAATLYRAMPLTAVNEPPMKTAVLDTDTLRTVVLTTGRNGSSSPVAVLNAATR